MVCYVIVMERILISSCCFLIVSWSVLELCQILTPRVFAVMDLASCLKFVVLGFGSQVFGLFIGLVLFLVFGFGRFKFLQVSRLFKGSNLVQLLCNSGGEKALIISGLGNSNYSAVSPKCGLSEVFDQRIIPCKCIADSFFYNLAAKKTVQSGSDSQELVHSDDDNDDERIEDEESDVASLRALVKAQRRRAERAWEELERERLASASAVKEVMAMILVLQTEKGRVKMKAKQHRRKTKERQQFYEGLVDGLELRLAAQQGEIRRLEQELRAVQVIRAGDHQEKLAEGNDLSGDQ